MTIRQALTLGSDHSEKKYRSEICLNEVESVILDRGAV
jgi:hypothetical protein